MCVMTVNGSIAPDKLGITDVHEHIYLDIVKTWIYEKSEHEYKRALLDKPVTMDILGILRRDPTICRDNLRQDDHNLALREVTEFKNAGGQTIVDVTNKHMGRNPEGLRMISQKTGINMISATGFYVEAALPDFVKRKTIDELAAEMIEELTHGMDGTEIKAGIIGEIGTSVKVTPNETKILNASSKAQLATGVPIYVHTERPGKGRNAHTRYLRKGRREPKQGCNRSLAATAWVYPEAWT